MEQQKSASERRRYDADFKAHVLSLVESGQAVRALLSKLVAASPKRWASARKSFTIGEPVGIKW